MQQLALRRSRDAAASESHRRSSSSSRREIAALEARVAELEGKLAEDWANMDVLSAHRAARDELKALLGTLGAALRGDGIAA